MKEITYEIISKNPSFAKTHRGELYYFVWDGFNTWYLIHNKEEKYLNIGYMKLIKYNKIKNGMQVDGIDIHKNYHGNGLSTFMYRMIQSKKNYSIVSDYKQYGNSLKIWTSLVKKDGVKIYDEITNKKTDYINIKDFNDSNIWGSKHSRRLLVFESKTLI